MKVRINDDAHGYEGYDRSRKGSWASWVEKYRGIQFEVVEDSNFSHNGIWRVVTEDRKYPNKNGIHISQATIVDEEPVEIKFQDLSIGSTYKFKLGDSHPVCMKISDDDYLCLEAKPFSIQYKTFSMYGYNQKVYPVPFKLETEAYIPKLVKNYTEFKVDNDRTVTIYKNGSVVLESSKFYYTKDKEEVEKIIKWGMTNYEFGHGLTPDSTLEVGCQKFTIKQIRDFTTVYNSFVNGENNA